MFGSIPVSAESHSLTVGLATYSLRDASIPTVIRLLQRCGVKSVAVYDSHVPIRTGTPEQCRAAARQFRDAGIALASSGVVELSREETIMRPLFENARAAELPVMACTFTVLPDPATLRVAEKFAREYNVRLAVHNHGPEDPLFPSPRDAWRVIADCDPYLGLCLDVGHAYRAGTNPAEAILEFSTRLYDVHLNDTAAQAGERDHRATGLGMGRLNTAGILQALQRIKYSHQIGLEDEMSGQDPFVGVANSLGYIRGLLAAAPSEIAPQQNSHG